MRTIYGLAAIRNVHGHAFAMDIVYKDVSVSGYITAFHALADDIAGTP